MFSKNATKVLAALSLMLALTLVLAAPADAASRSKGRTVAPPASIVPDPGKLALVTHDVSGPSDLILPGALIYIYDEYSNLVVKGSSDDYGTFGTELRGGVYKMHIIAYGYKDVVEPVTIIGGEATIFNVGMTK